VRRWLVAAGLLLIAAFGIWWLLLREGGESKQAKAPPRPTAVIGSGSAAVAVGPDGQILVGAHLATERQLPSLPLSTPPKNGKLGGSVLEQARVLGAAPPALRPHLESSSYGETGVDVMLRSGIELRFGDASQAAKKWKAAAAVLADPSIEALDYVDLSAPGRPSVYGSGHTLPPAE
jgi:Cell division protein FtsQ